ncbi:tyrosine-type recombinase/integrase [Rhodococcoides kroppenstedtii]|uniref:tyrosine-type recombinase/integrase n=1 Tax=Rhodococcoides kroppenstedtii TaxID=293050 RepID=UPI0028ED72AF|nr:site-specific integrase [Rhodococcus kroppenstedtii]
MATVEPYETSTGGKRWEVRYRTPDRGSTRKRGFATKRDATAFANTVEAAKLKGEYVAPADGRMTVGEAGAAWLGRRSHLKPSSARTEDVAWRVHVEPRWSGRHLGSIKHSEVAQWVAEMSALHGPVTVRRSHALLAGILDEAVRDRRLASNPARGVKLPRRTRKARAYLTHAQVRALATEAGARGIVVWFLAYTGLRWGELAGLHIGDVDTRRRRVAVERNAVNVGGHVQVGSPKTHERRTVPLPAFLVNALDPVLADRAADSILFPDNRGGYSKSPGVNTWFAGAVARCMAADPAFPRVTPHDLRHTAASLAVSSGANVKAVQRMLGHASAVMTLDTYADLFDDDLEAVASALDAAVRETERVQSVSTAGNLRLV